MKKFSLIITLIITLISQLHATNPESRLFHFERSTNDNIVCYDINLTNGKLNPKKPLYIYWATLKNPYKDTGEINFMQRTVAFGFKIEKRGDQEVTGHLTASNKLRIRICKYQGKWVAMCTMHGKQTILKRMYVKMKSAVTAEYVDAFGETTDGGEAISVRFK